MLEMVPYFRDVDLLVVHVYQGDHLKQQYEAAGIRVVSLNIPGRYSFVRGIRELRSVIGVWKPDVIHSTLLRSSVICRWVTHLDEIPHVGMFVNDSYVAARFSRLSVSAKVKLRIFQVIDRLTSGWCDHFVAITEAIRQSNARYLGLSTKKISVIYRGRHFGPYLGIELPKTTGVITFLNLARLIERKGQVELIHAFAKLRKRYPARLWLAGEGPMKQRYQQLIDDLGLSDDIKLLGRRDDVPELLAQCTCLVMPSHFEGLGGAIIEGMLAARPVIATSIPVLAENVKDGWNGMLFEPGDIESLAAKMELVVCDPSGAIEMGKRGRELATQRFDLAKIAGQYESVYRKVLG
jgi:glycosyltransferase involved in cell wall biosynthesis